MPELVPDSDEEDEITPKINVNNPPTIKVERNYEGEKTKDKVLNRTETIRFREKKEPPKERVIAWKDLKKYPTLDKDLQIGGKYTDFLRLYWHNRPKNLEWPQINNFAAFHAIGSQDPLQKFYLNINTT